MGLKSTAGALAVVCVASGRIWPDKGGASLRLRRPLRLPPTPPASTSGRLARTVKAGASCRRTMINAQRAEVRGATGKSTVPHATRRGLSIPAHISGRKSNQRGCPPASALSAKGASLSSYRSQSAASAKRPRKRDLKTLLVRSALPPYPREKRVAKPRTAPVGLSA